MYCQAEKNVDQGTDQKYYCLVQPPIININKWYSIIIITINIVNTNCI